MMYRNTVQLTTGLMAGLIALTVIAPAAPPHAQKAKAQKANALVTQGHALFLSNCSPCHGANAQGDDGPNLHHKSLPDTFIATAVKEGFKDEMPSFGQKLKTAEITALVAYVHSLQK